MKNKKVKYLSYAFLLIASATIALTIILKNDFYESINLVIKSNILVIFLMLLLMVLVYALDGLVLSMFAKLFTKNYNIVKGTLNSMVGIFFNGITPSATGGQFVQAYIFTKQGLRVSSAASVLLLHFIAFQVSMVIFTSVTLIFGYQHFVKILPSYNGMNILTLSMVGFCINLLVIGGLYFLAYSRLVHRFITVFGINLLTKLRIIKIKNKEKIRTGLELQIRNFKKEAKILHRNYWLLIRVILILLLRFVIFYSIPFFVLVALRQDYTPPMLIDAIATASFVYLITSFFPLPGASGGAEGLFVIFFSAILYKDSVVAASAVLIWRFVSFYFGLIAGGIIFFLYRGNDNSKLATMPEKVILTVEADEVVVDNQKPRVLMKPLDLEASKEEKTD